MSYINDVSAYEWTPDQIHHRTVEVWNTFGGPKIIIHLEVTRVRFLPNGSVHDSIRVSITLVVGVSRSRIFMKSKGVHTNKSDSCTTFIISYIQTETWQTRGSTWCLRGFSKIHTHWKHSRDIKITKWKKRFHPECWVKSFVNVPKEAQNVMKTVLLTPPQNYGKDNYTIDRTRVDVLDRNGIRSYPVD